MIKTIINYVFAVIQDGGAKLYELTGLVFLFIFLFCLFFGVLLCVVQVAGGRVLLVVGGLCFPLGLLCITKI